MNTNNTPEPTDGTSPAISPPTPEQRKTTLDQTTATAAAGPGDSPLLPKGTEDLLNDGIADQKSRRGHRTPIVVAALVVLAVFTMSLAGIVGTLGTAFYQALQPENIAKFAAAELTEKVSRGLAPKEAPDNSAKNDSARAGQTNATKVKSAANTAAPKEVEPIKVVARIYGEIRDSMVPLVALVSILAVAIVVILGTMLKAAFAPHPNAGLREKEDATSPLPIIEAIKGLVDSVKAAWK